MSLHGNLGASAKKKILLTLGGSLFLLGAAGLAYSLLSSRLPAVKEPPSVAEETSAASPAEPSATPEADSELKAGEALAEAAAATTDEASARPEREQARIGKESAEASVGTPASPRFKTSAAMVETPAAPEAAPEIPTIMMKSAEPAAAAIERAVEKWNPRTVKAEASISRATKQASTKRQSVKRPSTERLTIGGGIKAGGSDERRAAASNSPSAPSRIAIGGPESPEEPASASASPLRLVDEAMRRLVDANVAFNSPPRARLGKDLEIVAKISAKLPKETLAREVDELGTPKVVPLKVSDRVAATLSGGSAFDISPAGPQEQAVSENELTTWSWKVTPKAAGEQMLTLTFDAYIQLQGKDVKRTVRTLTQKISVDVGWPESVSEWLEFIKKQLETANGIWVALLAIGGAVLTWARKISPGQSDTKRAATQNETADAREGG